MEGRGEARKAKCWKKGRFFQTAAQFSSMILKDNHRRRIHNSVVLFIKKQTKKTNIKQKVKTKIFFSWLKNRNYKLWTSGSFFVAFLTNCTHHKMSVSFAIYNACILFCDCLKITKRITQNTQIQVQASYNDCYHKTEPFSYLKEKQKIYLYLFIYLYI